MRALRVLADAWRKNGPEISGLWNGALPEFVTARRPPATLAGLPVFSYHVVEAENLEADLEFLALNEYHTFGGRELLDYLARRNEFARDRAARLVLLTFDDGPRNFFEVAFPLLQRYRARAVAFIAPGLHADSEHGTRERDSAHDRRERDAPTNGRERPMTWQEIASVHASGLVEFQSHTLESRFAPDWPAPVPLAGCDPVLESRRRGTPRPFVEDLALSAREIEGRLPGSRVDQLAFPMYVGTTQAIEQAQQVGFAACYWGLLPGRPLNRPGDSPFYISRMSGEFVRRLPGSNRVGLRELLHKRMRAIQAAREWRRRFQTHASPL